MPGCAFVKFRDKPTIVVAGGEDSNGNKLNDVEILQFEPSEDGITIKDAMIDSIWEDLPSLKSARSNFPSVGIVEGFLTVTAGKIDSSDFDDQVSVESFDEDSYHWNVRQDIKLKTPRYGHSTLKIPSNWCRPCKRNFQGRKCQECAEGFQGPSCNGIPSRCFIAFLIIQ